MYAVEKSRNGEKIGLIRWRLDIHSNGKPFQRIQMAIPLNAVNGVKLPRWN